MIEKTSAPINPSAIPTDATISPTSPREISPAPSWIDSRLVKPANRAPMPPPSSLLSTATTTMAIRSHAPSAVSSRALADRPTLTKKMGTKTP
jgi:hypothetical protein